MVPWKSLPNLIEPCYPMAGRGWRPYPPETMLRAYLVQSWCGSSDPAMEETLYDKLSARTGTVVAQGQQLQSNARLQRLMQLVQENHCDAR